MASCQRGDAVALSSSPVLSDGERAKAMKQWERVTFRIFGLMGLDSRHKVGEYIRLAEKVMNKAEGGSRYSEIMESLRGIGSDYPIEAAAESLKDENIYEWDTETCRYILWRYEEYLASKIGPNATIDETERAKIWKLRGAESIEHVFPQSPEPGGAWTGKMRRAGGRSKNVEDHVHRIGIYYFSPLQ